MGGIFVFSQKCPSLEDKLYGIGDGGISPSTRLEFFFFFFFLLFCVLVAGLIMKSTPDRLRGEKETNFNSCMSKTGRFYTF